MNFQLILLFLAVEIISGLLTFNFYKAAGRKSWEAFIPVYRIIIMLKIIERPWWWVILCYMPVVGNVMAIVVVFELLHVFNFRPLKHTIFTILTLGLYLGYINFTKKLEHVGRNIQDMRRHVSELAASLLFAIVAASAIRAFTFEAFTIPTPSMEKSLLVGDFLFVSKMHYGSRPPLTPLALPLVHNKIPFTRKLTEYGIDSYLDWIQLPYWRFPKFQEVQRGEAVVFNYPAEDIRYKAFGMEGKVRPVDKREHYVKRCVGIPGDSLKIIDRQVMINGDPLAMPEQANPQWQYYVRTNGRNFNPNILKEKYDINFLTPQQQRATGSQGAVSAIARSEFLITIPEEALAAFKQLPNVVEVRPINGKINKDNYPSDLPNTLNNLYRKYDMLGVNQDIFPNPKNLDKPLFKWTRDNYGPLWIPKEGATIKLNTKNFYKYQRAITAYEGNTLKMQDGAFILNGNPATEYTFEQDYYWMMGDNRHSSDDSRYWGFVPEDHIVGKPVFIWMSWDKYGDSFLDKIRTERIFTVVHSDGPRRSYFWHFVVVALLIYLGNKYYKSRKKKKTES